MCRGPLAYGHATAVSTGAFIAPSLWGSFNAFPSGSTPHRSLRDLRELLARPGTAIPALDLATSPAERSPSRPPARRCTGRCQIRPDTVRFDLTPTRVTPLVRNPRRPAPARPMPPSPSTNL